VALADLIKQEKETGNQTSATFPSPAPLSPPSQTQPVVTAASGELKPTQAAPVKPKLIKGIAIFVSYFAFSSLLTYEIMFLILFILDRATGSNTLFIGGSNIFRILPLQSFIPIPFFALSPIILIYCCLKILDGSRKSWLMTLSSLIGTQIFNAVLIFWLLSSLAALTLSTLPEDSAPMTSSFGSGGVINTLINFLPFLTLIGLLIAKRKFYIFDEKVLSTRKRLIFLIFVLLIIIPNFSYLTFQGYRSLDKTPGLEKAQKLMSFHIYTPSELPMNIIFDGIQLQENLPLTESSGIRIILSSGPLNPKQSFQERPPVVTLSESTGINELTEEILSADMKGEAIIQKQPISTAKNGFGFYSQKSIIRRLTFLTPDNVLINLVSPEKANFDSLDYLLIIANSLK